MGVCQCWRYQAVYFLPKSTSERWRRVSKKGNLGAVGKGQRPLTELERELAQVKRELALAKMERDNLKKAAAYFAKESL
jgi:transposase